ncbi:MAG: ArsA family ATPase [Acidimicrobiales bacterium]
MTAASSDGVSPARLVVVTGKGGVGKTTVAAATAARAAEQGRRTLVVSTDPAHSLADVLGRPIGDEPTAIGSVLHAQQLDARLRLERRWAVLRGYLAELLHWAGASTLGAEELTVLPGAEELLALTGVADELGSGRWDLVVVDCAPTAETMRLLSLPEVLTWWMDRVLPVGRRVGAVLAPAARALTGVPVAGAGVWDALGRLQQDLTTLRDVLTDGERTSVRLVTTAEKVVVAETRRTATYLALFGLHVDAVVANRLLPDRVVDPFFDRWRRREAEQLTVLAEGFAPVPVLRAALGDDEPVGVPALRRFAREVYGRRRPAERLHAADRLRLSVEDGATVLDVDLGFAERGAVELARRGDELVITVGPYRRAVVLPDQLAGRPVLGGTVRDGRLQVRFAPA